MNKEIKTKKFPLLNAQGETLANITLEHLWADVFALKMKLLNTESLPLLQLSIREVLDEARSADARMVIFRLVKGKMAFSEISNLLPTLGFKKKSERIDFKKSVSDLPNGQGSPVEWKIAEELGWNLQMIAEALRQVAVEDPDTDPNEDPLLFVQDFLADPVLTSGLHCIHIGFVDNEIAAFTVVQINPKSGQNLAKIWPKSGWSRISYMGILPKFRKQNIGRWVHRYSFDVMRSQGGTLYHGGTTSTNIRMIKLFESSGCDKFCEMEEWNYSLNEGDAC